jgi:regulatory protein
MLTVTKETELERARKIWRRKFSEPPANQKEKARQIRFLQHRGFTNETIKQIFTKAN